MTQPPNSPTAKLTVAVVAAPPGADSFEITLHSAMPHFVAQWGMGQARFLAPRDVAVDAAGHVYVADGDGKRVVKFDGGGEYKGEWGGFTRPGGVAVAAGNHVFVADTTGDRVQKCDDTGSTPVAQWGSEGKGDGQFQNPLGVATDARGDVYVADTGNDRIQKFDADGNYLGRMGGARSNDDGQFYFPGGVAVDGAGNVYVADSYNHRIQKFNDTVGTTTIAHGQSYTFTDLPPGTYRISDNDASRPVSDISCSGGGQARHGNSVTVMLAAGDDVSCTLTHS